jgi:hypothetical protein
MMSGRLIEMNASPWLWIETGLEAILVISILIESFIFLFIIIFVWSIEYEGSKQAYSSHYLWHEITVSTPFNNANKADDKWKVLS